MISDVNIFLPEMDSVTNVYGKLNSGIFVVDKLSRLYQSKIPTA